MRLAVLSPTAAHSRYAQHQAKTMENNNSHITIHFFYVVPRRESMIWKKLRRFMCVPPRAAQPNRCAGA